MKKLLFAVTATILVSSAAAFAVGGDENSRASGDLSFDNVLNKLADEYSQGLKIPAAPVPQDVKPGSDDRFWVTVRAADNRGRTRLLEAGMDIIEIKGDKVSGIIPKSLLPGLETKSFRMVTKIPFSEYIGGRAKDFPAADAAYHNYQETADLLAELAAKNTDIASLFSIGKTTQDRDIWCLRLNPVEKGERQSSKPGVLYIGNHHAREHLSNEVPLLFAVWLLDNRNDPEIKKHLDTLDIYIIPMLNPDGVEHDVRRDKYNWYRKNMSVNSDGTFGVDLNRNYDERWCQAGASKIPGAPTYCGAAPFSEPETKAVKRFIEARKNLKTLMSYHSYGSLVLYPWGGIYTPVENEKDRSVFEKMGKALAAPTKYKAQQASDLYAATGDTCDWAYANAGIFAFTTELEGFSFYPDASVIKMAVTTNIKAATYLLSVTDNPYKVLD